MPKRRADQGIEFEHLAGVGDEYPIGDTVGELMSPPAPLALQRMPPLLSSTATRPLLSAYTTPFTAVGGAVALDPGKATDQPGVPVAGSKACRTPSPVSANSVP